MALAGLHCVPGLVALLVRTHRIYEQERQQLWVTVHELKVPIPPRHRVVVLIDHLDQATVAALRYARTLRPTSTIALHCCGGSRAGRGAAAAVGRDRIPFDLEVIESPQRDLIGDVVRYVTRMAAEPGTEVTVLLPSRRYDKPWHLLLHDFTSWRLARRLSHSPHVNVTIVPFRYTDAGRG